MTRGVSRESETRNAYRDILRQERMPIMISFERNGFLSGFPQKGKGTDANIYLLRNKGMHLGVSYYKDPPREGLDAHRNSLERKG